MRYYRYTILLSIFLLSSCSGEKCQEDQLFESKFNNCVEIVKRFNNGAPVRARYRYASIECLEAVTEHKSRIDKDGDTPYFYESEGDFVNGDLPEWGRWFKEGKCHVTLKMADSLIELHSKMTGELNWPPDIAEVERDTLAY